MAIVFEGARQILTCERAHESCILEHAAIVVKHGTIVAIGNTGDLRREFHEAKRIPCVGCVITPGLVDSHTHAVFGGWRAGEYELRSRGVPYMEIARRGGGINASVRDVRGRSEDALLERTLPRLAQMAQFGTTTAEVKSGYGLTLIDELKLLRVIRRAAEHTPIDLVPTFLGAHEFPPEFRGDRRAYVDLIINQMIPIVAEEALARFCDVFMEPGVFDGAQTRAILEAGRTHGLIPRLHADELENSGAAELAVELDAASADHLGAVTEQGIQALAGSNTVATLLPGTLFFLGKTRYAPARALIDAGATVAPASDFNPGASPSAQLPLLMTVSFL